MFPDLPADKDAAGHYRVIPHSPSRTAYPAIARTERSGAPWCTDRYLPAAIGEDDIKQRFLCRRWGVGVGWVGFCGGLAMMVDVAVRPSGVVDGRLLGALSAFGPVMQGGAGAAEMAICFAVVRDLYSGRAAARAFSALMAVSGVAPLFLMVLCTGLARPNAAALALDRYPDVTGSAAAVLGMIQFALGAVVAPVTGLDRHSVVPLGVTLVVAAVLAVLARSVARREKPELTPSPAVWTGSSR
jgi:hypothetical protein